MSTQIPGGWSAWNFDINSNSADVDHAIKVLETALEEIVGAEYEALAFTNQVVAGMNYVFLCKLTIIAPDLPKKLALVRVHEALNGSVERKGVEVLGPDPNGERGSWASWNFPPDDEQQKVFDKTLGELIGVEYNALGATQQVVNGINFCFVAKAEKSIPDSTPYPVLSFVFQSTDGELKIESIDEIKP